MRLLNNNQVQLMENLIRINQNSIKKTLSQYLKSKYKRVVETKDYLYAIGDIPIALVAHMDTVFEGCHGERNVYYDRHKNVMFCPQGGGFDDKAGIFAIIQIIRKGLRPHIIFTTDEEKGCIGADKLSRIKCPFDDLRYIIQLDRRGANDCVFYDCDNTEFVKYVENFGFVEAIGSFTDICSLCPEWKVAGVNLSIGYRDEHSISEVLFVRQMLNTIDKVCIMLQEENIPKFEYIPLSYACGKNDWFRYIRSTREPEDKTHCHICGKEFLEEELIPVSMRNFTRKNFCIDCIPGRVDWCNSCGEAYELPAEGAQPTGLCEDCWYDMYYNY